MRLGLSISARGPGPSGSESPGGPPLVNVTPCVIDLNQATALVNDVCSVSIAGVWSDPNATISYQWLRNGSPIGGATANSYVFVIADAGQTITVVERATNSGGSIDAASSNSLTPASLTFPAHTGGEAVITDTGSNPGYVDSELTVTETPTFNGNESPLISYQWERDNIVVGGATSAVLEPSQIVSAGVYRCLVTAINSMGSVYRYSNTIYLAPL